MIGIRFVPLLPMQISCESACSMLSGSGQSLFSVGLNLINCNEECFEALKSPIKSLHGVFYAWHHLIIQLRYKIFNVNDKFEPKSVPEGGSNLEISNKTHPLSQRVSLLKSGILNKAFHWLMVQIFPDICRFSQ